MPPVIRGHLSGRLADEQTSRSCPGPDKLRAHRRRPIAGGDDVMPFARPAWPRAESRIISVIVCDESILAISMAQASNARCPYCHSTGVSKDGTCIVSETNCLFEAQQHGSKATPLDIGWKPMLLDVSLQILYDLQNPRPAARAQFRATIKPPVMGLDNAMDDGQPEAWFQFPWS